MNITQFLQQKLYAAIRNAMGRMGCTAQTPMPVPMSESRGRQTRFPCTFTAPARRTSASSAHTRAVNKPLRIVRVVESGQSQSAVGRMVISGRMADVCAELDRLVAHEAALQ
jgi:hypothetical protein